LRASPAPLLAIFGELDTPEGVKANVRAISQNPGSGGTPGLHREGLSEWVAQPYGGST
jgi:hypothetical protein